MNGSLLEPKETATTRLEVRQVTTVLSQRVQDMRARTGEVDST